MSSYEQRRAQRLQLIDTSLRLGEQSAEGLADSCRNIRGVGLAWQFERAQDERFVMESDLPEDWTASRKSHYVWNAGLFAEIDGDDFERILLTGLGSPAFSFNYVRKKADRLRADRRRADRKLRGLSADGVELYAADIHEVEDLRLGSASAVITDPPYEQSALSLWEELGRFSERVLVTGGWLVAMSGQRWLPGVIEMLASSGLRYCWTMAISLPGAGDSAWLSERNNLNYRWKPILVYSKGEPSSWPDGLSDVLESPERDKDHHEWGQSVPPYEKLCEFAPIGGLVVDPFLGGGTTAVAAHRQGRAVEGFDLEPAHVTTATERMDAERQLKLAA